MFHVRPNIQPTVSPLSIRVISTKKKKKKKVTQHLNATSFEILLGLQNQHQYSDAKVKSQPALMSHLHVFRYADFFYLFLFFLETDFILLSNCVDQRGL